MATRPTTGARNKKPTAARARSGKSKASQSLSHTIYPTRAVADPALARDFAIDAARALEDDKCSDVVVLHVAGLSQLSDYIIIATGTSDRQMRSAAADVESLAQSRGFPVFGKNADDRATWIVVDCVDVVVHVFEPNARAHYDLEMLWGDAPRIDAARATSPARDRAGLARSAKRAQTRE